LKRQSDVIKLWDKEFIILTLSKAVKHLNILLFNLRYRSFLI
jgi:hypothetical protein